MTRPSTPANALNYITETFVEEDTLLRLMRAEGEARRPGMQISPLEGKLLFVLARMVGATHALELGTFMGYSSLWLARALGEEGHLTTIEADPSHAQAAQAFFMQSECSDRISLLEGRALERLPELKHSTFDLIFIDAVKAEYAAYLDLVEPMLRPGGLILGDNSLLFGALHGEARQKTSPAAIDSMGAFNARLANPLHYEAILLPTSEGLTIARKR